jgi:hypothetical protein
LLFHICFCFFSVEQVARSDFLGSPESDLWSRTLEAYIHIYVIHMIYIIRVCYFSYRPASQNISKEMWKFWFEMYYKCKIHTRFWRINRKNWKYLNKFMLITYWDTILDLVSYVKCVIKSNLNFSFRKCLIPITQCLFISTGQHFCKLLENT